MMSDQWCGSCGAQGVELFDCWDGEHEIRVCWECHFAYELIAEYPEEQDGEDGYAWNR